MSPTLPIPEETRYERLLIRAAAALAALGFAVSLGISLARATGALKLADDTFAVLAIWSLSLACLGLGIAAFSGSDPRAGRALAKLDFGNPELDDVLDHDAHPPWRARRGVPTACGYTAAACWVAAIPYSTQMALGTYRVPPVTELFVLGWMLGVALWGTVLSVAGYAERRRDKQFKLICEMHHAQRETRDEGAQKIAQAPELGNTGELPRLRAVNSVHDDPRAPRLARYDDTA